MPLRCASMRSIARYVFPVFVGPRTATSRGAELNMAIAYRYRIAGASGQGGNRIAKPGRCRARPPPRPSCALRNRGRRNPHLEHLTKPAQLVEADQSTAEGEEGMMDVGAALVADGQAAEAVEPGQRALDDPAVPAEPVRALDTPPSNARFDVTPAAGPAAGRIIISLVGVQLIGSAAG